MKEITILDSKIAQDGKYTTPIMLRLPYIDLDSLVEMVNYINEEYNNIYGIMAPYSEDNLEFNIRCAARLRDQLPGFKIYATVPFWKAQDKIRTIFAAGFPNIVIPLHTGTTEYDHHFQFIDSSIMDNLVLHIAGGKFTSPTWNKEGWTWSKERL